MIIEITYGNQRQGCTGHTENLSNQSCSCARGREGGILTNKYSVAYFHYIFYILHVNTALIDFRMPLNFRSTIFINCGLWWAWNETSLELQACSKQDGYFRTCIILSTTDTYRHSPGLLQRPPDGLHPAAHTAAGRGKEKNPAEMQFVLPAMKPWT